MNYIKDGNRFIFGLQEAIARDPISWEGWQGIYIKCQNGNPSVGSQELQQKISALLDNSTGILAQYFTQIEGSIVLLRDNHLLIVGKIMSAFVIEQISEALSEYLAEELRVDTKVKTFDLCWQGLQFTKFLDYLATICFLENQQDKELNVNVGIKNSAEEQRLLSSSRNENHKPEVLLVEDDRVTSKLVENLLRDLCNVRVTDNIEQASEYFSESVPDAILLDIGLPDGDGREFLSQVSFYNNIEIIMFSSDNSVDTMMNTLNMGATGFVSKPFNKEKLLHYIKGLENQGSYKLYKRD